MQTQVLSHIGPSLIGHKTIRASAIAFVTMAFLGRRNVVERIFFPLLFFSRLSNEVWAAGNVETGSLY